MGTPNQFCALDLSFPLPSEKALRFEARDRELIILVLAGLSAVYEAVSESSNVTTPTSTSVSVGSTAVQLAPPTAGGNHVSVFNNGAKAILICDGAEPHFAGGPHSSDLGILLKPGGLWESPRRITTAVRAIAKSGESTTVTVTRYS